MEEKNKTIRHENLRRNNVNKDVVSINNQLFNTQCDSDSSKWHTSKLIFIITLLSKYYHYCHDMHEKNKAQRLSKLVKRNKV